MKTYTVGIVAVAILMVVAGVGFGIAQAAGNHSDRPVLSFEDQEALEQGSSSSLYVLVLPSAIDVDYGADGNPSSDVAQAGVLVLPSVIDVDYGADGNPSSDVAQASGPVETGAISATGSEESWMKDYGND